MTLRFSQTNVFHLQVLSFCNLTMEELKSAVDMFCAFIDRNTYALFYYNGHAIGHGNDVYLVSKDTDFQVMGFKSFLVSPY